MYKINKQERQDNLSGKFREYDIKMYRRSRSSIVLFTKLIAVIFVKTATFNCIKFNNDILFTKYYM
jgi:hypothetical protein